MTHNKKNILVKPFYGDVFLKNNIFKIDDGHNIFFGLKDKVIKKNILLNTVDAGSYDIADKIVYCDVPYPWQVKQWINLIKCKNKNILFCFESPIVNPFSSLKIIKIFFKKIYTWNDDLIDNKKYFKFNIPQVDSNEKYKKISFKKRKFLVMISGYKNSPFVFRLLTKYKTNLYNERLKVIEFFENSYSTSFDLYGRGWDKSKFLNYKTYKGEIKGNSKNRVMSNYKFCMCLENTLATGYITEKIFDCFKSGCVPIYLGANNVEKYIDKNSFIDFRKFSSFDDLYEYLVAIKENEYKKYLKAGYKILKSRDFVAKWSSKNFEKILISEST